jgi:hypothetical protein
MKLTKIVSPANKRRHHNNKGNDRIKRGLVIQQISRIAEKLGIPHPHRECNSRKQGNVFYF